MLLTIHDANLKKVAIIDNDKQETLNFFNDTWTRYLETGSSTFDFTVFKKAIISDTGTKRAYNYLNEKAFVSFEYKGKTYLHTIRKVEENEKVIKCYGVNLNLELINEYANPYKSSRAMSFQEFCEAMDLLNFTFLSIGINEISTKKITAEWEGSDTKLARLLSLAKKFGAEIEFDTYLKADSSIKAFVVNVYHEHDDQHQGVGRVQPERLTYGKNLKTLTRTVDKTNIYNMVRPTGKTENGDVVTISGLSAWSVNNAKGEREFYQSGEGLYAPLSMAMYPAAFTSGTMGDQWIRKDMSVDSSSPEVIRTAAYRELKKHCYPAVTYEAEGFLDLDVGDTVQVYDDGFSPALLLEMRVSEQAISFTNKANNKTTFANAKALENRLSGNIQARLDQLIEDAKPYVVKLATDNGVAFKNQTGESVITPTLTKGGKQVECGWRWVVDGQIKSTSPTYLVRGRDVTDILVVTVAAWLDNREVASEQLTFINTNDGRNGSDGQNGRDGRDGRDGAKGDKGDTGPRGPQGERGIAGATGATGSPGARGADGRSSFIHIKYAPVVNPTDSQITDTPNAYIGVYTDYNQEDSTRASAYTWTKWKGSDGANGIAGPKGADGRTTYVHFAYANSANGQTNFSTSYFDGALYMGTLTDFTQADSKNYSAYTWSRLKGDKGDRGVQGERGPQGERGLQGIQGLQGPRGDQGIAGPKGADGRSQYTHIAYADTISGSGFSQTDRTKAYIGMYQDFTATDSRNPADYRWSKWKGDDGAQGIPGPKGADGRTPYIHFAYAESADGQTGFSLTQTGNKRYMGTYTDFTEADSRDAARYRWVDMVGTVEIDHVNLVENSKITRSSNVYGFETRYVHLVAGKTYYFLARAKKTGGTADKRTRVYVYTPTWNHQFHLEFNSTEYETRSVKFTARYTERYAISSYWFPNGGDRAGTADIDWYMVVESNVEPKHWSPNPNDFTTALNSKADQVLTQEQLNALAEKAQVHEAELAAKASMEVLSDLEKAYNAFVKSNGEAKKKSEADLIEAGRRIDLLTTQFGGLRELKTFIDTYMTSSNEGLVIGKNDASSTIKVSHDRISMFSAGKEVMYISQGVIHIDNGIFTASVQIGRFRTEQYHLNADMNVTRYVG
ncbi:phage tail spike protein [Streptococcus sp. E17BB]|uniref:phage tail spike protein n=1 Tax=Streptococcus sp. E17BB TaxID=3278714 RepID=UPI00359EB8DE